MQIVSYLYERKDVIELIIAKCETQIREGDIREHTEKIVRKIQSSIELFIEQEMIPNGNTVRHLNGPIHELRIAIPNSKYLLRILFAAERGKLMLLTGSLIKAKRYSKKNQRKQVEKKYKKQIKFGKTIYKDRKNSKKLEYTRDLW